MMTSNKIYKKLCIHGEHVQAGVTQKRSSIYSALIYVYQLQKQSTTKTTQNTNN